MSKAKPAEERLGKNKPAVIKPAQNVAWVTPKVSASVTNPDLWNAIWELGGPTGVYHAVADYHFVERYCQMIARRNNALKRLEDEGWTTIGSQGQEVIHPLNKVVEACESKLTALEDRLGLNPTARNVLSIGHVEAETALEKWLSGK